MEDQNNNFILKQIYNMNLKHLNNITELIKEEKYEYIYSMV